MLIKFADKRINEFKEGNLHFVNEGQDFEVPEAVGTELLKKQHNIDGENLSVFEAVDKKISKSLLPEDFPMRAELEEGGILTLEQLGGLKLEDHENLKGIGVKSMQKVLDAYGALPPASEMIAEPVVTEEGGQDIEHA